MRLQQVVVARGPFGRVLVGFEPTMVQGSSDCLPVAVELTGLLDRQEGEHGLEYARGA